MHFVAHGHTAADVIPDRADAEQLFIALARSAKKRTDSSASAWSTWPGPRGLLEALVDDEALHEVSSEAAGRLWPTGAAGVPPGSGRVGPTARMTRRQ
jgi:hypothetical protein